MSYDNGKEMISPSNVALIIVFLMIIIAVVFVRIVTW